MEKLVLATSNQGKIKEFQALMAPLNITVVPIGAYPGFAEVEEDGTTFAENALKKARAAAAYTGEAALADDSGLMVDALNGAPGVYSARFAGEQKDNAANNRKLLELLQDVPEEQRTGRFCCVIALVLPAGEEYTTEGACEGIILRELRGTGGFGYDPLFYVPAYDKTFAELDMAEKNQISHRGIALRRAAEVIKKISDR